VSSFELDVARYRALPLSALDNRGGEVNLPDRVPVPSALAHAKVGLLGGFDLGVKAGALNFKDETGDAETEYDSVVYGAELRKKLLGGGLTGAALPDVALSLSYDAASGEATRKERYNGALRSGGTLAADTVWKTEWNVSALTARAVASKTLLMITPYAGVGYRTPRLPSPPAARPVPAAPWMKPPPPRPTRTMLTCRRWPAWSWESCPSCV
jgi:hypothetical protein